MNSQLMVPLFRVHTAVEEALACIRQVLESGYVGEGPACNLFEQRLAEVLRFERVLLTNSGTMALKLALRLCGARPGAEVISTPQTCLATNMAILATGARIVWADVDPATGLISPDDAVRMVTPRTVAVVGVDWAGRLCDWDRLRSFTRGVSLVEDAAHAFGADRTRTIGGHFVCYSLQAIKHLNCADGGVLVTPGKALHERARLMRWFGLDRSRGDSMRCYQHVAEWGEKGQSNDVLAALGLANLVGVGERVDACRANALFYSGRFEPLAYVRTLAYDAACAYWFYPLQVSSPIAFERFMASRGIAVGQVHARNDTNSCFDESRRALPGVDFFSAHQTNIPCGWHLSEDEREKVARAVEEWNTQAEARW